MPNDLLEVPEGETAIGAGSAAPGSLLYEAMVRQQARPKPKQAPARNQQADLERRRGVFQRLLEKGQQGIAVPGEGMVPFGVMPDAVRQTVKTSKPIVGFDPAALAPDERLMLMQLQRMGEKENTARRESREAQEAAARAQAVRWGR